MLHNVLMHVGSRDYSNSERNSGRKILSNIITLSAGHAYSKRKRITCELWQHCDAHGCHYTKHASTTFFFCFFLTVKTSVGIGQVVASTITKFETEEMLKASNSENLEPLPSL